VTVVLVSLSSDDVAAAHAVLAARFAAAAPAGFALAPPHAGRVQDYVPPAGALPVYVSSANSFLFMDGGVDLALRAMWPGVEPRVRALNRTHGRTTLLGRPYLPIGSALATRCGSAWLVMAPTMLLPQRVPLTRNAYWAVRAALRVLEDLRRDGRTAAASAAQVGDALADHAADAARRPWRPLPVTTEGAPLLLEEPNLDEQPRLYQNREWFDVPPHLVQGV
jgi:hypothetical protein